MKATLLQTDIVWGEPMQNRQHISQLLDEAGQSDLYVLPEMFSTGFMTHPKDGISADDTTLAWMQQQATDRHCALAGSLITDDGGKLYNRFYFVYPDGSVRHYDKRHLFIYGGEDRVFTPGEQRVVVRYAGFRILLQVCYDLRFPVFSRNKGDYDLAIYVANWPTSRLEAWTTLLHARAIENQCYVIGVNRVGQTAYANYSGGSEVVDAFGHTLATCGTGQEAMATAELHMGALEAYRREFPVLNDTDGFSL
jgi:predicted amidohydrolase